MEHNCETLRKELEARITLEAQAIRDVLNAQREYFSAVLEERGKATDLASDEREKAARELRENLERQLSAGDHALERHITEQIASVRAALIAQERQLATTFAASEKAISKSESSYNERFSSANKFKDALSDQVARFVPREVSEAKFKDIDTWRATVDKRLYEEIGKSQGVKATTGTIGALIAGSVGVITIIVVLANVFTGQ